MNTLTIAALSTPQTISSAVLEHCKQARCLFTQTSQTPCVLPLQNARLSFQTMDELYEQAVDFDALQRLIAGRLLAALPHSDVTYAVPGNISAAYMRLRAFLNDTPVNLLPGTGYAFAAAANGNMAFDAAVIAAASAMPQALDRALPLFIEELDTVLLAGELKLLLLEYYPPQHEVSLFHMQKDGSYTQMKLPLYALDRQRCFHATTVLAVPPLSLLQLERFGITELQEIIRKLRRPGGCPWDREQTHETLKKALIEECYEVLDAIDQQDDEALCEELGDVLMQCVFHADIAGTERRFTLRDITTGVVQKLIYRHPHVFSTGTAKTSTEVLTKWEELKKAEKHFRTQSEAMRAVPTNLPALMRAGKVQKKAAQVGFDWPHATNAMEKLREEIRELESAMAGSGNIAEEAGDVFFSAVNVARLLGLDSEDLLTRATNKFINRFEQMEEAAFENGDELQNLGIAEQDKLWDSVKKHPK